MSNIDKAIEEALSKYKPTINKYQFTTKEKDLLSLVFAGMFVAGVEYGMNQLIDGSTKID